MSSERMGRDRYSSRSGEIEDILIPLVVSERTCLGFFRAFCERFNVSPSGADSDWGPIEAWLPEGRIRWDRLLSALEYSDVRLVIHEAPGFFASFAVSRDEDDDAARIADEEFDKFPDPTQATGYRPKLPDTLIPPKSLRTVWTLTSNMHHGADIKSGNINLFRRERSNDPIAGTSSYLPFVAGNAVRGMFRDMMFGRWLQLHGLKSTDIPPFRAHAFFAGGHQEKGADSAVVNNVVRSKIRGICPPWDLFAGCIEQQIMSGRARIGDATLVCRENAWKTYGAVNPGMPLEVWAMSLPEACTMTQLRLGTRHKHADIEESDGVQMLFNTELLVKGYQMVHTIQLAGIDGVDPVTASCLADLLVDFQMAGYVGAGNARSYGEIAFDPYQPGPGTPELPDPTIYLEFVEQHKQEAIDWIMSPKTPVAEKSKAPKKGAKAKSVEPDPDIDAGGHL